MGSTFEITLPAVVLVHGACHGPASWAPVADALRGAGLRVHAVDLPSAGSVVEDLGGLEDDADAVRRAAASAGPCVVVAHSYGGVPTTQGLAGLSEARHVVYLAAFMPDAGESLTDLADEDDDGWIVSADGRTITASDPVGLFYGACTPAVADAAVSALRLQLLAPFVEPVSRAAWRERPSTYVVCGRDRAIRPEIQERLAARAEHVRRIDTDHSPFLSTPSAVAEIVLEAARRVA